jgi:hypothetical protein
MGAKDKYHDIVRLALERDGWIITDDPLPIKPSFGNQLRWRLFNAMEYG